MTEGVTQAQFFDAVQKIQTLITERADKLEAKLDEHAADDLLVANRVLVIETERTGEKAQAMKRATWVGFVAAAAMTGFWKIVEHYSK